MCYCKKVKSHSQSLTHKKNRTVENEETNQKKKLRTTITTTKLF